MSSRSDAPRLTGARLLGELLIGLVAVGLVFWALRADDAWVERHMTPMYCVAEKAQLSKAHVERVLAVVLAVVLVLVARPRVGRALSGRSIASLVGPTLRILLALAMAAVVTDGMLRYFRSRHAAVAQALAAPAYGASSMSLDATVGGRRVHYAINKDGFRTRTPDEVPDRTKPTILFNGESVAFGHGLDYDETIPAIVAERTGVQTASFAASGAANDESLGRLERWLPEFSRPVAVVTFIVYNWVYRNIGLHRSRLALGSDGGLVPVGPEPELLWTSPLWDTARNLYHSEDAVGTARAIMLRTHDDVRARGAYPLFVITQTIPRCISTSPGRHSIVKRLVDGTLLSFIELDFDDSETIPGDVHPNARGAARFAEAIERALRDAKVVPVAEP